jgi:hypothetical protein
LSGQAEPAVAGAVSLPAQDSVDGKDGHGG